MAEQNFPPALDFVWSPGFDDPTDGYHVTPGDPGKGTKGGVIEATWQQALQDGLVQGTLRDADVHALSTVLRVRFWGDTCDALKSGLDALVFNGRMMSGRYGFIVQQTLGFTGRDLDGQIGPQTVKAMNARPAAMLIPSLHSAHLAYLQRQRDLWSRFGNNWSKRLSAARFLALRLSAQP